MPYYSIELDLTDKTALVVGFGSVGRRKARGLIAAGAKVVAVDPAGGDGPEGVMVLAEPYRPEHLRDVVLAFAAATPEVNRRVVASARAAGVWVNAASDPGSGDFLVPAVWQDGLIRLAASTSGASPGLATALRDRAAQAIGSAAARLAAALAELRTDGRIPPAIDFPEWLILADSESPESLLQQLRAWMNVSP